MQLNIASPVAGSGATSVEVSDRAFAGEFNEDLVHQVVNAYLAGGRQGTRAQKNRSQVRGGGAKPWRQKGTGRARAGTASSPIWRSGGVTFAAGPQDHSQKVNRKMYRGALRAIYAELCRQGRLHVVADFGVDQPKTRLLVEKLKGLELSDVLIVTEESDRNLELASRNLYSVQVVQPLGVDPVSLISHQAVLVTVGALKKIEELLA